MKKHLLLGATKDNEIVFANVEIKNKRFTASFNAVRPRNLDDINWEELADDYLECCEADEKFRLCVLFNCKPSDLADRVADEVDQDVLLDTSLYPKTIECYDYCCEYIFESSNCGQYDSRNDMEEYFTKNGYDMLMKYWDQFHLKEIDNQTAKEIEMLVSIMDITEEQQQDWIAQYIEKYDL